MGIKGKVEQSREWSSALPYTSVVAIEKGVFGSSSTKVANFAYIKDRTVWNPARKNGLFIFIVKTFPLRFDSKIIAEQLYGKIIFNAFSL